MKGVILALLLGVTPAAQAALPSLQEFVDATPAGGTLRPAPGRYAGPVVIRKALHLEGRGQVVVDGGGVGTVIRVEADGVTLEGLTLRNSGESHDRIDSGVQIRGDRNRIADNRIENCLFGIDLQESDRNEIRGNQIGSKPLDLGVRGDAIRLWYSRENQILDNRISGSRDVVVWYSGNNLIARTRVSGGRYALHFMYSEYNQGEANRYSDNMVGVFLMYSDGVVLRDNHISNATGATGMGIGFKESSDVRIERNAIVNCARGIYLDISPYRPDTLNHFVANRIAYNGVGVMFHSDWHSNVFHDNEFKGNFSQVAVRGGGSAKRNVWQGNRWDDYRGFDRDGDGRGDSAYELYSYADGIWIDVPMAAFFRASPLFEVLDFLDRLVPFSEPTLLVRDESPRFSPMRKEQPWPP
jgi:nitrous oxidase accessory protein